MFPTRIPVAWHHNRSSALPSHIVTSDGALVLLQANHSAQGIYSCYDNRGLLLHSIKLRLGRKCCRVATCRGSQLLIKLYQLCRSFSHLPWGYFFFLKLFAAGEGDWTCKRQPPLPLDNSAENPKPSFSLVLFLLLLSIFYG